MVHQKPGRGGGTFNKFPSKVYPVPRGRAPALHFAVADVHAELAEGFQFSVGDVAHISLRRGANCPMLPI
jgi:hypothetical protein